MVQTIREFFPSQLYNLAWLPSNQNKVSISRFHTDEGSLPEGNHSNITTINNKNFVQRYRNFYFGKIILLANI